MPSHTLLGGLATTIVGGSIAAGVGYAMMPEKKSNEQQSTPSNEPIFVPPNFSHTTNYLVLVVGELPTNTTTKATCTLNDDCQLFSKRTKAIITNEQTNLIRKNNGYIFNTNINSLNHKDVVELTIADGNKVLLLIQSKPTQDKSISIKPTPPDNFISKRDFLATFKNLTNMAFSTDYLHSKNFYNIQEDTYINRQGINHDSFLILEWNSSKNDQINTFHLAIIDNRVDPYIFKSFEDQAVEKASNPELITTINTTAKTPFIEIYEIQNEDAIKEVMASLKSKETPSVEPNWDVLAQESLMLTKLTELQEGKYYKFVFSDFEAIEKEINRGLNNLKIDLKYSDSYKHTLLSKKNIEDNYFCAKFSSKSALGNKCSQFSIPPPLPPPNLQ